MVEKLVSTILTFVGEILQQAVNTILGFITLDKTYMDLVLPGFKDLEGFIEALGFVAVAGCLVTVSIQMISSPLTGQERSGGISAILRAILAGLLVPVTVGFSGGFLSVVNKAYNALLGVSWEKTVFSAQEIAEDFNTADLGARVEGSFGIAFLSLLFAIVILFQMLKLVICLLTRFVTLVLCLYLGPLCVGFFASPATTNITVSWIKTMLSQSVLILVTAWGMHVMFVSLIDSGMFEEHAEALASAGYTAGSFVWAKYVMIYFLCKVLQKLEDILRGLGFNPFPTGANVRAGIGSVIMLGMGMARAVSRLAGGGQGAGTESGSSSPAGGNLMPAFGRNERPYRSSADTHASYASDPSSGFGFGGVSDYAQAGIPRKRFEEVKTGKSQPETSVEARVAANGAFSSGGSVEGSVLNRASEGTEGHGKTWMYDDGSLYRMDADGHVKGPMLIKQKEQWKKQERVTDFSRGRSINGKEFIDEDGTIRRVDTGRFIATGENGTIRSYALRTTGETVSSREDRTKLLSEMERFGKEGYQAENLNAQMVLNAYAGSQALNRKNGTVRIPETAEVKQVSQNELLLSGAGVRESGEWKERHLILNTDESKGISKGTVTMPDGKIWNVSEDSLRIGPGASLRQVHLVPEGNMKAPDRERAARPVPGAGKEPAGKEAGTKRPS